MNAIVTVVAKDRVGIIGATCIKLSEYNINILDISQTILHGTLTMVMAVDMEGCKSSMKEVSESLAAWGKENSLSIHIQREEIFDAMFNV